VGGGQPAEQVAAAAQPGRWGPGPGSFAVVEQQREQETATQAKLKLVVKLKNEMRKLTENSSFVWRFFSNDAHT
jgi:hypothetical protein